MTTLSIIIPCFNRADYAEQLAQSIPDQSDIEILWIDDHSKLPCFPVRVFTHANSHKITQNTGQKGQSAARNKGVSLAKGEYIIFVDDDDLLENISDLVQFLQKKEADLIISYPTSFTFSKSIGSRHSSYAWLYHRYRKLKDTDALWRYHSPTSKVFKTEFLRENSIFFPDFIVSEDALFNAMVISKNPFHIPWTNTFYRIREGHVSLTSSFSTEKEISKIKALKFYNEKLKENKKHHLCVGALSPLMKIIKKDPKSGFHTLLRLIFSGQRIFPTQWTLSNAYLRKKHYRNCSRGKT